MLIKINICESTEERHTMERQNMTLKTTMNISGGSHYFAVPKRIIEYLEIQIGDDIEITIMNGKHGKYAAFWKKE